MQLAIFTTGRCNAQCQHCTTNSGPNETQALRADEILRLMDAAAALRASDDPLVFGLTGGEVFLDFELLLDVVRHGRALGARVTCTTNGYWASSDDKARELLGALHAEGLGGLAVSTSRFHQRYVRIDRVRRALTIAHELGIPTCLKCAFTADDRATGWVHEFAASVPHDELQEFPVVPYLRERAWLPDTDYVRDAGLPAGPCPAPVLTVREDGAAYTCCTPGAFTSLLRLGDARREPLARLRERYFSGGVQQVLREHGPIRFAQAAMERGEGHRLRSSYGGVCDLCAHVANDPVLARIAAECGEESDRGHLQAVFRELMESVTNQGETT